MTGMCQSLSQLEGYLFDSYMANGNLFALGKLSPGDASKFAGIPSVDMKSEALAYEDWHLDGKEFQYGFCKHDDDSEKQESFARKLTESPPRTFYIHIPIDKMLQTIEVRSLDLKLDWEGENQLVGIQATTTVEEQVRSHLWYAPQESQTANSNTTVTTSGSPITDRPGHTTVKRVKSRVKRKPAKFFGF